MSVLIAGGAGFIGSHLTEKIGGEVFDLKTGQDGRELEAVKKAVKGKELVFHLANFPAHRLSVGNPHEIVRNNYLTTLNFAEACRLEGARMVFASSFGVYGKQDPPFSESSRLAPETPYGVAKKSCEELLKVYHDLYGMDIIIVRPSNVWGERDHLHEPLQVLPTWVRLAKGGKPLVVHGENTSRDFTHIDDFIEGILLASSKLGFNVYNLASGKEVRLVEIARFLSDNIKVEPLSGTEVERWCGDITKAREELGWEPKRNFWEEFRSYCNAAGIVPRD